MSMEVLKQELAGLAAAERSRIMAYLVALQDRPEDAYRATLARKIDDTDLSRWVVLEDLDRRLDEPKA